MEHIQTFKQNLTLKYLPQFLTTVFFSFSETDLIPATGTFIFCLVFPLEIGILLGVGLNLLTILYNAARPKITAESQTVSSYLLYLYHCKMTCRKMRHHQQKNNPPY